MLRIRIICFVLCFLVSYLSQAQYEKKLTLSIQGGVIMTMGGAFNSDQLPHLWSNYDEGYEMLGALQYNHTDRISSGFSLKYLSARDWDDPRVDDDLGIEYAPVDSKNNAFFNSIAATIFGKYKLSPQRKVSPFFYTGIGINVFNAERSAAESVLSGYQYGGGTFDAEVVSIIDREPAVKLETGAAFNLTAGPGVEVDMSEFLDLMLQVNYNVSFTRNNPVLQQNISHLSILAGVNLNLFRSKSF